MNTIIRDRGMVAFTRKYADWYMGEAVRNFPAIAQNYVNIYVDELGGSDNNSGLDSGGNAKQTLDGEKGAFSIIPTVCGCPVRIFLNTGTYTLSNNISIPRVLSQGSPNQMPTAADERGSLIVIYGQGATSADVIIDGDVSSKNGIMFNQPGASLHLSRLTIDNTNFAVLCEGGYVFCDDVQLLRYNSGGFVARDTGHIHLFGSGSMSGTQKSTGVAPYILAEDRGIVTSSAEIMVVNDVLGNAAILAQGGGFVDLAVPSLWIHGESIGGGKTGLHAVDGGQIRFQGNLYTNDLNLDALSGAITIDGGGQVSVTGTSNLFFLRESHGISVRTGGSYQENGGVISYSAGKNWTLRFESTSAPIFTEDLNPAKVRLKINGTSIGPAGAGVAWNTNDVTTLNDIVTAITDVAFSAFIANAAITLQTATTAEITVTPVDGQVFNATLLTDPLITQFAVDHPTSFTIAQDQSTVMHPIEVSDGGTAYSANAFSGLDVTLMGPVAGTEYGYDSRYYKRGEQLFYGLVHDTTLTQAIGTTATWQAIFGMTNDQVNGFTYATGVSTDLTAGGGSTFASSDAGLSTTITSGVAHGLSTGDFVTIVGCSTAGYNGQVAVSDVSDANTFKIAKAFIDDPATEGDVIRGDCLTATAAGAFDVTVIANGYTVAVGPINYVFSVFKNITQQDTFPIDGFLMNNHTSFTFGAPLTVSVGDKIWLGIWDDTGTNNFVFKSLYLKCIGLGGLGV